MSRDARLVSLISEEQAMARIVTGLFEHSAAAERTVARLRALGIASADATSFAVKIHPACITVYRSEEMSR